ncbi:ZPR1 zinc-finger domain-containing protein [Zopfochytrium polystomum]|nr:ZPR1 zinc-finger domain-containing protein [Zopfochytrium polystomum]
MADSNTNTSSSAAAGPQQPQQQQRDRLFEDIDVENRVQEVESYCVNCEQTGTTRLLLTLIPHFREVIIMAFDCPHCGFRSNEIQSGSAVREKGCMQQCKVSSREDLNRQLVKSENASVKFVELDFEIPASTQRGVLTTVEGLITKAAGDLGALQPQRKLIDEAVHDKIQAVIDTLLAYTADPVAHPFTFLLDDPTGNSYIENYFAPAPDPALLIRYYPPHPPPWRNAQPALAPSATATTTTTSTTAETTTTATTPAEGDTSNNTTNDDDDFAVHVFPGNCSRCNAPSETRMRIVSIPYFKEVVIMATNCDVCGYKSNEVKAGGAISAKGKRIILKVTDEEDLNRDVLKSETCGLRIPELDLELTTGTLGGRFTTLEGLLRQVHDELVSVSGNSAGRDGNFAVGDSADAVRKRAFAKFLAKLESAIELRGEGGKKGYTLILDDPLANSYLQNPYAPDEDPNMTVEFYERTNEENEFLGLNDMVTEGYEAAAAGNA